jgi:hypothetical protein
MAFVTLIPPGTGAVATKADFDATAYQQVIIAADALAGIEIATVFIKIGSAYVPAGNLGGVATGLTAAVGSVILPGGVTYGVTKGITVGPCGVYATGVLVY